MCKNIKEVFLLSPILFDIPKSLIFNVPFDNNKFCSLISL